VSPADNTLRILANMSTLLDRLKALLKAKKEHECLAAVRLQAAAWGLGTPAGAISPWGEASGCYLQGHHAAIIGGAGSGAPASSRARFPCPAGGADVHAAQLVATVYVQPLGLAHTSCDSN
jgi:hypothetical protein